MNEVKWWIIAAAGLTLLVVAGAVAASVTAHFS